MAQQRSEETRRRILAAAEECFSHSGYETASLADICEAAGVSKGAFYHHFPSKHTVFLQLLNGWLEGLEHGLDQIRASDQPTAAQLRDMASLLGMVYGQAGDRFPLFLEFWLQAMRDPDIWKETIQPLERYTDYFTQLAQNGVSDGSLKPGDPAIAARTLIAYALGMIVQGLLQPTSTDWPHTSHQGLLILLDGLENKEPK